MVRVRVRRGLVILAAIAAGLILLVVVAVHTPMARGRALAWASSFVTRYHLELEAGNLGYNAITRRITLTDVRLAAEGHHDRPFLIASRIEVTLPWSVFRRRFAIDHLDDRARHRRHRPRQEQRREPAAVFQRADSRARARARYPLAHAQRPRRAVRGPVPQLGREGPAHRIRAAQQRARRDGQLRRPRQPLVPPARSRS